MAVGGILRQRRQNLGEDGKIVFKEEDREAGKLPRVQARTGRTSTSYEVTGRRRTAGSDMGKPMLERIKYQSTKTE